MKKVMVVLGAIALAISAQASTINWKLTTGTTAGNVYAFGGVNAATVLAACQSSDAADWDAMFSGITKYVASGATTRTSIQGETNGIVAGDALTFVFVNGNIAEGSTYTVYDSKTIDAANVFDPPATGTQLGLTLSSLSVAGTGTFQSVPEPTSGLLMLLGMAGLALRRRRA